jgi:hypothetical protein
VDEEGRSQTFLDVFLRSEALEISVQSVISSWPQYVVYGSEHVVEVSFFLMCLFSSLCLLLLDKPLSVRMFLAVSLARTHTHAHVFVA